MKDGSCNLRERRTFCEGYSASTANKDAAEALFHAPGRPWIDAPWKKGIFEIFNANGTFLHLVSHFYVKGNLSKILFSASAWTLDLAFPGSSIDPSLIQGICLSGVWMSLKQ